MDTGMTKNRKVALITGIELYGKVQLVTEMVREDLKIMARNVPSVGVTKGFAYA